MNVYVYTRHSADCSKKEDSGWRRCTCPKWLYCSEWTPDRRSAKTRSWARADEQARQLEAGEVAPTEGVTVEMAVSDYLRDKVEQNVGSEWLDKLTCQLERELIPWCKKKPITAMSDLDVAAVKEFRSTWTGNPLTRSKKQERLRSFFLYCQKHGWVKENPAAMLSRIKVDRVPTDYFTQEEFRAILDAVDRYHAKGTPETRETQRARARAMILLLRWSGLRLGDAARLERSRLSGDKLFLYTQKTGTPVWLPLNPTCVDALKSVKSSNPRYFFWTGNGDPKTTVDDWWRTLSRVFKHANLGKRAHPHMFRDTFAVGMLLSGVPLDQVSILLGHSSIKITEKHYSPFVKARQDQLEQSVRSAW